MEAVSITYRTEKEKQRILAEMDMKGYELIADYPQLHILLFKPPNDKIVKKYTVD